MLEGSGYMEQFKNIHGLKMMQFEAQCNYELIKYLISNCFQQINKPEYGCESGLASFVASGYQLDASVFLYEAIKMFEDIVPEQTITLQNEPEYLDMKVVRNNIHTFSKGGGFSKKTECIRNEKLTEYKLDSPDWLFPLRNDISLVFEIVDSSRRLIGSDYFISHCFFESNNKKWNGLDYRNYAAYISSNIKALTMSADETLYELTPLYAPKAIPQIELFDFKSADLFANTNISNSAAFRIMLILHQISYGILLTEKLVNRTVIKKSDLWTCFLTKLLAIKYDESIDNLKSILRFSDASDQKILSSTLEDYGVVLSELKARAFSQHLRNTIHYQKTNLDISKIVGTTTKDYLVAIYLSNSDMCSIEDFRQKASEIMLELKALQAALQQIFSLNKEYKK